MPKNLYSLLSPEQYPTKSLPPCLSSCARILSFVFKKVHQVLNEPDLENDSKMLRKQPAYTLLLRGYQYSRSLLQIEADLTNRTWFSGGHHATSADFLMGFTSRSCTTSSLSMLVQRWSSTWNAFRRGLRINGCVLHSSMLAACVYWQRVALFLFDFQY